MTITYEIELSPSGKKIGFNSMDDGDFRIPYIIYMIPNSLGVHQIPAEDKENGWIMAISVEYTITTKGKLDKLQRYQT